MLAFVFSIRCLSSREGTFFVPVPNEWGIHVGIAKHRKGYHTPMHYHVRLPQEERVGTEALIVLEGRILIRLKHSEGITEVLLRGGEGIILRAPHEVIYADDSAILEVKEGPYPGPEKDKVFIISSNA